MKIGESFIDYVYSQIKAGSTYQTQHIIHKAKFLGFTFMIKIPDPRNNKTIRNFIKIKVKRHFPTNFYRK